MKEAVWEGELNTQYRGKKAYTFWKYDWVIYAP